MLIAIFKNILIDVNIETAFGNEGIFQHNQLVQFDHLIQYFCILALAGLEYEIKHSDLETPVSGEFCSFGKGNSVSTMEPSHVAGIKGISGRHFNENMKLQRPHRERESRKEIRRNMGVKMLEKQWANPIILCELGLSKPTE